MYGQLNVRDLPAGLGVPSAVGDGCTDDTDAIEGAIRLLFRTGAQGRNCAASPTSPDAPPEKRWPAYYSELYVPAGVYRITRPIVIDGILRHARIVGDGGRGGSLDRGFGTSPTADGSSARPDGTVLRQDTDDAPIFVFTRQFSNNVSIERIGFSWRRRQNPPPGFRDVDDPAPRGALGEPGAVGILFSSGAGGEKDAQYFHFTISDCKFEFGFRGVAIDESLYDDGSKDGVGRTIALFDTQVERCHFDQLSGAAISYVNRPGFAIGMTSNAVRDVFIQNYNFVRADGTVGFESVNFEEQIRIEAQGCCTLENIDAEGSKRRVLSAVDCVLQVTNLYLERVELNRVDPILIFFGGGGRYAVHGMNLDGLMFAQNYPSGNPSTSTVFNLNAGAELLLSGIRTGTFPSVADTDRNVNIAGGFLPLNGPARLVSGPEGRYRFLDRPQLPVLPESERGEVFYERADDPSGETEFPYRALRTYDEGAVATSVVELPPAKASADVAALAVPANAVRVIRLGPTPSGEPPATVDYPGSPVTGALPGDVVAVGVTAGVPPELVVTGVVAYEDTVDVRVANVTGTARTLQAGRITVTASGGPLAGRPQIS